MTIKHTPGPWEIGYGDSSKSLGIYTSKMLNNGSMEAPICLVSPTDQMTDQDMANAKVIAAAPDLLEALIFCKSVIANQGMFDLSERMAFDKAEAAIKKTVYKKAQDRKPKQQ